MFYSYTFAHIYIWFSQLQFQIYSCWINRYYSFAALFSRIFLIYIYIYVLMPLDNILPINGLENSNCKWESNKRAYRMWMYSCMCIQLLPVHARMHFIHNFRIWPLKRIIMCHDFSLGLSHLRQTTHTPIKWNNQNKKYKVR